MSRTKNRRHNPLTWPQNRRNDHPSSDHARPGSDANRSSSQVTASAHRNQPNDPRAMNSRKRQGAGINQRHVRSPRRPNEGSRRAVQKHRHVQRPTLHEIPCSPNVRRKKRYPRGSSGASATRDHLRNNLRRNLSPRQSRKPMSAP